jgi:hypothetical protein
MIIQTDLAPRDDALAVPREFVDTLRRALVKQARVVRVDAHRRVHALVSFGHRHRALQLAAVRIARPDIQDRHNPGLARTRHHLVAIRIELRPVNVRV